MTVTRSIFSLLLILFCYQGNALAEAFPRGCEVTGFGFNDHHLIINETGEQTFYLIQNHSERTIELQRIETKDVFMSPPLTAKIEPANWAAFASDIENLHFQCFVTENENTSKIDCKEVLDVCQYPRVKFALSNMGNYWVSTNKPQRQVINDATAKGIYLRW